MDTVDIAGVIAELRTQFPPELVAELLQATRVELAEKAGELEAALAGNDEKQMRRTAHSLKSTAGAIGVDALLELAQGTELAEPDTLVAEGRRLLAAVRELETALQRHGDSQ